MTAYYDKIKRGVAIPNGIYSDRQIEKCIGNSKYRDAVGISFGHPELVKKSIKIGLQLNLKKISNNSKGIYPVSFQEPGAINKLFCNYFLNICISDLAKEKILNNDLKLLIYLDQEPPSEKQFFDLYDSLQKSEFNNFIIYSTFLPENYENDKLLRTYVKPSFRSEVNWPTRDDYKNLVPEYFDETSEILRPSPPHDEIVHNKIRSVIFNYTCNNYDYRVAAIYYLLKNNLSEKCVLSYDSSHPIIKNFTPKSPKIQKLINSDNIVKTLETTYGFLKRSDLKRGDIHLTLEAYFGNNLVNYPYVTEKSLRSITLKKPFLVVGQKGTLNEVKRKGYKTFHPLIDESYDSVEDNDERFFSVLEQFSNIISLPEKEYQDLLYNLKSVVNYNYEVYRKKFTNELGFYL